MVAEAGGAFRLAAAAMALMLIAVPAAAETVTGAAVVIDGDTLEVNGRRIRLFGIDAPELHQTCNQAGAPWQCGKASAERLRQLTAGAAVSCTGTERDPFARLLAVCTAAATSLNATMVAEGWATAFRRYSSDYVTEEDEARSAKRGLWSSQFQSPEDYRRAEDRRAAVGQKHQSLSMQPQQPACAIKGNRSRRGDWIYHLPGMPWYNETVPEEIFCSEADAIGAGYRRSRAR